MQTIRWYETKKERTNSKAHSPQTSPPTPHPPTQPVVLNGDASGSSMTGEEEDAEWQVMGPKNKGSMTRKTEVSKSPISEM